MSGAQPLGEEGRTAKHGGKGKGKGKGTAMKSEPKKTAKEKSAVVEDGTNLKGIRCADVFVPG